MIKFNIMRYKTTIKINDSNEGETIENKIRRITMNNEPIKDGAPIIYMERKEGIRPEYDVRTDRFDLAINAMDTVAKTKLAKRIELQTNSDKAEPIQGTGDNIPA